MFIGRIVPLWLQEHSSTVVGWLTDINYCEPPPKLDAGHRNHMYLCRAYHFLKMDSELAKASSPTHYHSRHGAAHVAAS